MTLLWSGLYAVWQFRLIFRESMNLARDPTLDCVIHQHVGEPTHPTLSTAGMYAGKLYTTMGNYGYKPTCGIFLCRRGEVLRDPEKF